MVWPRPLRPLYRSIRAAGKTAEVLPFSPNTRDAIRGKQQGNGYVPSPERAAMFGLGKMKHRRIPLIEGHPVDEFLRAHADDGFLAAEGYFELLGEREAKRNRTDSETLFENGNGMVPF